MQAAEAFVKQGYTISKNLKEIMNPFTDSNASSRNCKNLNQTVNQSVGNNTSSENYPYRGDSSLKADNSHGTYTTYYTLLPYIGHTSLYNMQEERGRGVAHV